MDKLLPKGNRTGVLLLSALLLGAFVYFGFRYHQGKVGFFPVFNTVAAWVEEKIGTVSGGGT